MTRPSAAQFVAKMILRKKRKILNPPCHQLSPEKLMNAHQRIQIDPPRPRLVFAPLAWLKLQYFCHAGATEIAGFAITRANDPLHVEEFVTVRQRNSMTTVAL